MRPKLEPLEKPLWAPDAHSQTILGELLPSPRFKSRGQQVIVNTTLGDRLVCRLYEGNSDFVFVLAHGVSGNADANYMQRIGLMFHKQDHTVFLMNHRNCGEGVGFAKNTYHSGRAEDLGRICYDLRLRYPNKKVIVLGFSMSGNTALLLQSGVVPSENIWSMESFKENQDRLMLSQFDAAIAISPPVNLNSAVQNFTFFNRFYEFYFLTEMTKTADKLWKLNNLQKKMNLKPTMKLYEFDNAFTGPLSGFMNASTYYLRCSSQPHVHKVETPTFILSSNDDPFIHAKDLLETQWSSSCSLHIENFGGHLGFLERRKHPEYGFRWMDYALDKAKDDFIFG
jgi:predicted alpha/beta-fold hydrolase